VALAVGVVMTVTGVRDPHVEHTVLVPLSRHA
jgi:hypothetical protein